MSDEDLLIERAKTAMMARETPGGPPHPPVQAVKAPRPPSLIDPERHLVREPETLHLARHEAQPLHEDQT